MTQQQAFEVLDNKHLTDPAFFQNDGDCELSCTKVGEYLMDELDIDEYDAFD